MFVQRQTPLACQHGQAPGVWLVVARMTPCPSWRSGLLTAFNFKKISWAETAWCGLWWQPKVVQKAPFRVEARGLERQGPQGAVAFHPLAQRQALQCDNIAFAPASLLH